MAVDPAFGGGDLTFPARGTWIEITEGRERSYLHLDVPRKGNVDRNCRYSRDKCNLNRRTFPARGTWIEISCMRTRSSCSGDVPRKGNVDRNPPCAPS